MFTIFKNYFIGFFSIFLLTFGVIYYFSYSTGLKRIELLDKFISMDRSLIHSKEIQELLEITVYDHSRLDYFENKLHFDFDIDNTVLYIDSSMLYKLDNNIVEFKTPKNIHTMFIIYFITLIVIVIMQIKQILYRINNDNNKNEIINLQNAETKLASKNLSLLAENIHHELKTPLVVIVNKLEKIRENIELNIKSMQEKVRICGMVCEESNWFNISNEIQNDINLIEMHIDVIYNLLDRMKNFKNIKRSTENKPLYEVINVAFQTLELFSKNKFKYQIDPRLRSYIVYDKITSEDILNVFINHIKNSLEAKSTKLEVSLIKYHHNMVYLQLLDNGDGIPLEVQGSIYKPDFSTKEINKSDDESRGIGLYLSRTTLIGNGGDDFLIETSEMGTSFGINIPALRR